MTAATTLAATARQSLATLFGSGPLPHIPSANQWAAIEDLLGHLQAAAAPPGADEGSIRPAVYLSAIPPGTGKTASLVAFGSALATSAAHDAVGMLVLCGRITEVRDMALALGQHRDRLCVLCGDPEVTSLGSHATADSAQIVVATQASLRASLRGQGDFNHLSRFHYRGQRRAVICWDEAYAMRRPVIINADTVGRLAGVIRRQSDVAAQALKRWAADLDVAPGGVCLVPDFEGLGVDFAILDNDCNDAEDLLDQAKALRDISGATGWVIRENLSGPVMVRHVPELPPSLLPVCVTDASAAAGVNHESYRQMEMSGLPIVRLREAEKTYANLSIRLVPTAASRSVFQDRKSTAGRDLIEMAVRYTREVAPEEVLIVSYKRTAYPLSNVSERTIAGAINARLTPEELGRVRHLTWGSHTASNDHAGVRHVLLLGLNFLPGSTTYADSAALQDKGMQTADPADHPTTSDVDALRGARLRDSVLQAVLRGAARKGKDGDCGTMEAVIVQSTHLGLGRQDYLGMFPGAAIATDTVLMPQKALVGNLKRLAEEVSERLAGGATEVAYADVRGVMEMDTAQFRRLIQQDRWKVEMNVIGVISARLSGCRNGLRLRLPKTA